MGENWDFSYVNSSESSATVWPGTVGVVVGGMCLYFGG